MYFNISKMVSVNLIVFVLLDEKVHFSKMVSVNLIVFVLLEEKVHFSFFAANLYQISMQLYLFWDYL